MAVYVLRDHQFLEESVLVFSVLRVLPAAAHQIGNLLLNYVLCFYFKRRWLYVLLLESALCLLDEDFGLFLLDIGNGRLQNLRLRPLHLGDQLSAPAVRLVVVRNFGIVRLCSYGNTILVLPRMRYYLNFFALYRSAGYLSWLLRWFWLFCFSALAV